MKAPEMLPFDVADENPAMVTWPFCKVGSPPVQVP